MRKNINGFAHVAILIVALVVAIAGVAAWRVMSANKTNSTSSTSSAQLEDGKSEEVSTDQFLWQQIEGGWRATGDVPDCPDQPIMKMPADISLVTSILYPGQTRGGNYKPHGGFRFDNSNNADIKVSATLDGFIVRGTRYIADGEDEVQYTFDIFNNCGVMYRVGHFRTLPENLQTLANTWPEASASSATQAVDPPIHVNVGDRLADSVGIIEDNNVFFDWGVYDYRQENEASKDSSFQTKHADDEELSWHAVCWFDWLSSSDEAKIRSLPAGDPAGGTSSDYCI